MKNSLWLKGVAVPATLTLALGGALIAVVPANAAAADLTVTSHTVAGSVLTVTGQATPGETVQLNIPTSANAFYNRHAVNGDGSYSFTYTIPATTVGTANYSVVQEAPGFVVDGTVPFTAAAVPAAPAFAVTTPAEGATVASRTVTFTGTGTPGSTVSTLYPSGARFAPAAVVVGQDGTWASTGTFAADAAVNESIRATQVTGGGGNGDVTRSIVLPAAVPSNALTLATPAAGSTAASRTVTFSGTAPANSIVRVQDANGVELGRTTMTGTTTNYSFDVTFAADAAVAQSVTVNSQAGGRGADNTVTRAFNLPAAVPVTTFAVGTPTEGSTVASRTVTFTGTGTPGSTVSTLLPNGDRFAPAAVVVAADGTWSSTGTFADDAPVNEAIRVTQVSGGAGTGDITRNIVLPAAAVSDNTLTLVTPVADSTTDSRTVTFSGTAPADSIVRVQDANGVELGRTTMTGTTTDYSFDVTFAADADVAQTVTVNSFAGGRGADNTVTRSFNLPAAVPASVATPVITSPTNGQKLTGDDVTFTGTGTPGSNIGLAIVPTAEVNAAKSNARVAPKATAADPADPIVVGTDGTWTVTLALDPNDYTAVAVSALLNADGTPVTDAAGAPIVSGPSDSVEFTLAAITTPAPTVNPGGTGSTTPITTASQTGSNGQSLAYTGSDPAPATGIAALLLLAGGIVTFIARRRRGLRN